MAEEVKETVTETAETCCKKVLTLKSEALHGMAKLMDAIYADDEPAAKGTKAALRRIRVSIMEMVHLAKTARKDVLELMKSGK
ncbi:MAG: hypothetical protein WC444_04845 [Candidatus Paceibacterota bacterium]